MPLISFFFILIKLSSNDLKLILCLQSNSFSLIRFPQTNLDLFVQFSDFFIELLDLVISVLDSHLFLLDKTLGHINLFLELGKLLILISSFLD